jgi:hypothetical protein
VEIENQNQAMVDMLDIDGAVFDLIEQRSQKEEAFALELKVYGKLSLGPKVEQILPFQMRFDCMME